MQSVLFFLFQETLPGFKWIGSRVKDLLDNGKEVLFAFEESIGMSWVSLLTVGNCAGGLYLKSVVLVAELLLFHSLLAEVKLDLFLSNVMSYESSLGELSGPRACCITPT